MDKDVGFCQKNTTNLFKVNLEVIEFTFYKGEETHVIFTIGTTSSFAIILCSSFKKK